MPGYVELLGQYREKDQKTPQGETIPERETLNNGRLREYMDKNGFTADNFDTRFNVDTALKILQAGGTPGENDMSGVISEGQAYFVKIGRADLMLEKTEASFNSTLEKELRTRNELQLQPKLQRAYQTLHTVRKLCMKTLKFQQHSVDERKAVQVSTEKGLSESIAGVFEDVKKNYSKMNGTEKLIAVGGLIFGAVWLFSEEDNPKIKAVKDKLWSALKLGGLGVGLNYVYKLATGKTAVDSISDWSKQTVAKDSFWGDTFKTTPENGAILQKSTVFLGERDFLDMAKQYKEAKASGQNKMTVATVNSSDMTPEEIYTACDTFFKIYPPEPLELRYRKSKKRETWLSVVSVSVVEDGRLDFEDSGPSKVVDKVQEYAVRGWNGFWVTTEGLGLARAAYLKAWGTEPTDIQLSEGVGKLRRQLENEVISEGELDGFFDKNMSPDSAKPYKKLLVEGKRDSKESNIKSYEVPGDSVYIMSEAKLDASTPTSEKAVNEMLNKSLKQAEDFIKRTYPDIGDNIYKFVNMDEIRGVRVAENSTFKLFVRMPAKGSSEFSRKAVLATPPTLREEKRSAEMFGPAEKIEYVKLEEWDKQKFRINFLLDASQGAEIDKICKWFTEEYKGKSMTKADVMKALLTDEKVRGIAVEQTGVKQNLKVGAERLKGEWQGKLEKIEKKAASDFEGSDTFLTLQEEMKRQWGYNVRLLILGDASVFNSPEFQKYDPKVSTVEGGWFTKSNFEKLVADYEARCQQMVTDFKAGKV